MINRLSCKILYFSVTDPTYLLLLKSEQFSSALGHETVDF